MTNDWPLSVKGKGLNEKDRELQYIKIKLEEGRLKLASEGGMPGGIPGVSFSSSKLSSMIKFLPKFNERDPDVFFYSVRNISR